MNAKELVLCMYEELSIKCNFQTNISVKSQIDFEGFSLVICTSEFEDDFGLIVLPDGRILNDCGEDVYSAILSAYKHLVVKEYTCNECGTYIQVDAPAEETSITCIGCGNIVALKEVDDGVSC